ncbi:hypothetical protein GCM10011351_28200 [Paraliobacillus quinghaiensis]|uniref:Uncharacterized protein n=1 Tax=Paraliobacillus quinghaiensis TaxID=470815 RepID=A0A917WY77_9BACI|nr:hypothetical protein [Paraliobacillus quinghaiensis]GGM40422.1 hypothetical protein GCM10011351_28200 [Paraliobacillus quinghaiensis]
MKQEILMVKIQNAIKEGKSYYEATKGNWRINKARLDYIQYVVGVDRGDIVCAYNPKNWYQVEEGTEMGRSYFYGKEVDDNLLCKMQESKELLNKKFGRGQAVGYASLSEILSAKDCTRK